jgi:Beta propeller domain
VMSGAPAPADGPPQSAFGPLLLLVGLAGQPRVVSSYRIGGTLVDVREIGSVARVVISSQPRLYFPAQPGAAPAATAQTGAAPGPAQPGTASTARLVAANRAIIAHAGLDAWLPRFTETAGGVTITGNVPCTAVSRSATYSGAHLLTVLTFNLASGALGTGGGVTIAADGTIVYGTTSSLYVASDTRWRVMPAGYGAAMVEVQHPRTYVYRFDVARPGPPRFVAGGSVPGYLLDEYSLSEWNGYLRIATTTGTSWALADGAPAGAQASSSAVYVLTTRGPVMRTAGRVTGLGISERIYAVRFMGPAGYVVTFRQTDPLYTLDLSDPAHPRVRGTLALTGYSAYLHPASATRLIGIGQQADKMGHIGGLQVSLFDVSDLASPIRLATYALAGASSDAEFDPHAFLYWPSSHLVVVPLQRYDVVPVAPPAPGTPPPAQPAPEPQSGALVLELNGTSITETGFISQPAWGNAGPGYGYPPVERSLVIGQALWTLSDAGLMASSLTTLKQQAWIPFT